MRVWNQTSETVWVHSRLPVPVGASFDPGICEEDLVEDLVKQGLLGVDPPKAPEPAAEPEKVDQEKRRKR